LHGIQEEPFAGLELDAGALQIKSVTEGKVAQYFERHGELLVVVLAQPLRPDEHRTLTVQYQAGPAKGLKFFSDQIYTSSFPSDWMVCNNRPDNPATLHLEIATPENMKVAASGQLAGAQTSQDSGASGWDLDSPTPISLFGFAVGRFVDKTAEAEGIKLQFLGAAAPPVNATAAALRYFAERTGKHYPGQIYTQVFVHGDGTESLAGGVTLLPESYAQALEKQPENLGLLASQLAHQWYGVAITPKDWADLWLSDGVSAFLSDTFLERQYGKERYAREIEASREIYQSLRSEGKDRALYYPDWKSAQDADGPIPTQKGVGFLYLLRTMTGDAPFWSGLRRYTAEQWGQQVSSEDFQKAMAAGGSGGRQASPGRVSKGNAKGEAELFDQWVYGLAPGGKK
jgi:aminopeptidase N